MPPAATATTRSSCVRWLARQGACWGWIFNSRPLITQTRGWQPLRAALEALRPGGVLAAVLYSGKVIGDAEKQAALAFFKALPLTQYTVLVCEFANWAQTAPLPCFVIKK